MVPLSAGSVQANNMSQPTCLRQLRNHVVQPAGDDPLSQGAREAAWGLLKIGGPKI